MMLDIHILSICVFRQESETKITSQGYPVLEKQIYINWLEMNYVSPLHIYLCVQCYLFLILQVLTQCKNIIKSMILFMEASRALFLPEYPSTSIWTSCLRCSQNLLPTTSNQSSWISGLLWYHPYIALGEGYSTRYFYGSLFSRFKIPQSPIWTKY